MYLNGTDYVEILGLLQETDETLATQFIAFFTQEGDFYKCTDVAAYTSWVNSYFSDEKDLFLNWDTTVFGPSVQGGGTAPQN